jgi:hypothetical protein
MVKEINKGRLEQMVNNHEFIYARALQEVEEHLLTTQMMALDGINEQEEDNNEDNDNIEFGFCRIVASN